MADPYVIPGTAVLKNQLGIVNAEVLEEAEHQLVRSPLEDGVPLG